MHPPAEDYVADAFTILRLLRQRSPLPREALCQVVGSDEARLDAAVSWLEASGALLRELEQRQLHLISAVDLLDQADLRRALQSSLPSLRIQVHDVLESTNTSLLELAQHGAAPGSVLVGELQTAGRGRRGRHWVAALGCSLTFSVLWRFARDVRQLGGLSLAVGLAIVRALRELGAEGIELKWPNDLIFSERKLGGILVELVPGRESSAAIIGIGLNISDPARGALPVNRPIAALQDVLAVLPARQEILLGVLGSLSGVLQQFDRNGFAPFRDEFERCHAFQGAQVDLLHDGRPPMRARVLGVDADGSLRVEQAGRLMAVHSAEIESVSITVAS